MAARALSVSRNQVQGRGCLAVFFLIFAIAGGAMLYFFTIRPLWGVAASGDWMETPCVVLSSEVGVHDGDDGDTYSIDIRYEYTVGGRKYVGDRYSFMSGFSSSGRSGKAAVVRQYPAGAQRVCYVDPDNPESAVLNRGLTASMWWGLFPLPFLLVGVGGLIFVLRGKRPQPAASAPAADRQFVEVGPESPSYAVTPQDDLPTELRSRTSPGGALVGTIVVAVFWNSIVWLFVRQVANNFNWVEAAFLTPFVVIGFVLVGAVAYNFIAMFNPRPQLTLSRRAIPLGQSATLSWKFSGNVGSIRQLRIILQAVESATYRRGTDTHTDEETIYRHVLVEAEGMMLEVMQGEVEVPIPDSGMHSFEADHNSIRWCVRLVGEIPLRPDVQVECPFTVRPHRHD